MTASSRPVVGVIGCGYWGSKHVRILSGMPNVGRVVAVERDPLILDRIGSMYPSIHQARSFDEVAADVDAVIVATPPRSHGAVAAEALAADCHVMVEKPLATSVAEAEDLVKLADDRGLVLMSGHTFEYNPAVWKLRELIQGDILGRLYHVNTARLNLGLFHGDVNVLWDLAPHDLSILNYVLDSRPTTVAAWAGAHAHNQIEDVAYLRLHYAELDLVAQVHVSWLNPSKVRKVTVVGSRRMAVYDDVVEEERIKIFDKGVTAVAGDDGPAANGRPFAYRRGGIEIPFVESGEPLAIEDRVFVESATSGARPPSDGRDGLTVVRILAAAEQSRREGVPVDVDYHPGGIDRHRDVVPAAQGMVETTNSVSLPASVGGVAAAVGQATPMTAVRNGR